MNNPPQQSSKSILRRLIQLALVLFGALVLILIAITVPDQVRTLQAPPPLQLFPTAVDSPGSSSDGIQPSIAVSRDKDTTSSNTETQRVRKPLFRSREECFESFRPYPATLAIPQECQDEVRRLNHAADEMTSTFLSLSTMAETHSMEDVLSVYRKTQDGFDALWKEMIQLGEELKRRGVTVPRYDTVYLPDFGMINMIDVAARHKHYKIAANFCLWRDREEEAMYYWRQMGLEGRFRIFKFSMARGMHQYHSWMDRMAGRSY